MVYQQRSLDAAFGALADGTRRAILAQLARGDRTISEIASGFAMTLPAVSKHVRVLERAGLATIRREGRARRCHLVTRPLRDAAEWIDRYRSFWEASFDRLATYLDETLSEEDPACLTPRQRQRPSPSQRPTPRPSSKSAARSPRPASASSMRGRRRPR